MLKLDKNEIDRASELHKQSIIIAGHTDFQYMVNWRRYIGENRVYERILLPQLQKGGISAFNDHGLTSQVLIDKNISLLNLETILQDIDESPNKLFQATTSEDIRRAKKEGKVAIIITTQSGSRAVVSGIKARSRNDDREVKFLSLLYRLGVRNFQPATNSRNEFVDGCAEPANAGLSKFGMKALAEANRLGMIIDVAHMGDQGILDCAEMSKDPICTSHSNPREICDIFRNISNEGISAITEKGGIIGFHGMHYLLCPENEIPTMEHFMKCLKHVEELSGLDNFAVGPDIYAEGTWPKERYSLFHSEKSMAWRWLGLGDEWQPPYCEGFETYDQWPLKVTQILVHEGYSNKEIQKVLGENWLRIYKTVWGK